MLQFWVC